ncbi:MAG: hypothetical protein AUI57_06680 [Candidatus Rokubacteria bacterium 13_1_40CM_2_68_8]|nr:MAG: hypothetical protein AUI57_06680 [Candidatus Rokubacteria bacterium 13_1_40CM_2_68_8]
MKLVVLAESSADEAAIRILTEAIRGPGMVEWVEPPALRSRGWPAVLRQNLPVVIRYAHYRTDARAVIVVADTNNSILHTAAHTGNPHPDCRLCALRTVAGTTLAQLTRVPGRPALRVAIGAATPAIEAWYLRGMQPHPSEQKWAAGGARGYDKLSLKRAAYGTDRAGHQIMTGVAMTQAERLAANLALLRTDFPGGFGALETDILAL